MDVGCVNPAHLFKGSQLDNEADKKAKGRQFRPTGEKHHNCILNVELVRELKLMAISTAFTHETIAAIFGVTREDVTRILNHKCWNSVEDWGGD